MPSIASVEAENIRRNGATISATITDSQGVSQTVYVRHSRARFTSWRTTQQADSVDDIASLQLRGLSSGTEYIAEASLDSSFPTYATKSVTFTTREREDDDDGSGAVVAQEARAVSVPLPGSSPQMLRFTAVEWGDNPSPQTFSVWNRAQGAMSFTLSNQQEWLLQQPTSGVSNGPDDLVTIVASVDSSELALGQYVDIIRIDVSSSGKPPIQVIVVLDVLPPDYTRQFVSRDEGGAVILPDGTVKTIVPPLAPPKDVDIELMKINLRAHGQPPGNQERVVVAIESNTYEPGGDTSEDVAYLPYVELWAQLPQEDSDACNEGRVRVYSVKSVDWSLLAHRCETDESGKIWAVAEVGQLGALALVIDDSPATPTPTPAASAAIAPAPPSVAKAEMPTSEANSRKSLPAVPPTATPTPAPTAATVPSVKVTPVSTVTPDATSTKVPAGAEIPVTTFDAPTEGRAASPLLFAALGAPVLIGVLFAVLLAYRNRERRTARVVRSRR